MKPHLPPNIFSTISILCSDTKIILIGLEAVLAIKFNQSMILLHIW